MGQAIIRLLKSLLISAIVIVVAIIPCAIFNVFSLSPKVCYIVGGILGGVVTVIFYGFAYGCKWEFFFVDDGKEQKAWKANLPLLFHLLLVAGAILFMVFGMELVNEACEKYEMTSLPCFALGAFLAPQLGFYISLRSSHHRETCEHCKYIYTLGYASYLGSQVSKSNQYKTEKGEKEVGGIYAGSTKIASVNAQTSTQYSREKTTTTETYGYVCRHCGKSVRRQETKTEYSKWG